MTLIRAFHGTDRQLTQFRARRPNKHPSTIGTWLTDDADVAEGFARMASARSADAEPHVVEADVRLYAPKVYETYNDFLADWREARSDSGLLRRQLMRQGHDSVIITQSETDGMPSRRDVALFDPQNINIRDCYALQDEPKAIPTA